MKVSDILKMLTEDGWYLVATKGSHRQFKYPSKPGRVTVPGQPSSNAMQETLYLLSTPGMRESIAAGLAEPVEASTKKLDW